MRRKSPRIKVKTSCPVYKHILDCFKQENWSGASDFTFDSSTGWTWIELNGKGLHMELTRDRAREYIWAARDKARDKLGI